MTLRHKYKCTAIGPQNYNRIPRCGFEFVFEAERSYHCPQCGSPMKRVSTGLSVSEILAEGFKNERRQEAASQRPTTSQKENS